jgi:adhesin transport system outer membrane protein
MKQARYARSSAVAFYEGTVLQVALDVVDAYYATLRSTRRLALFETSRDRHQAMVVTIERRVNAMVSPAADLELARARLAQINQQVDLAKAQRDVALDRLRELLDDPEFKLVDERPKPATWPSFDGDSVLEEAKAYSPRLRQLRGEADVASADIQIARSALMPQISGQYLYSDFQGARAGVVVRLQTGAGLSRFTAIDSARERKKSSDLRIAAEERSLRNQIFAQHAEFSSSLARLPSSLDAAASAERVRQSYLRQFISGRRSWLDVMNSFQETTSADISVVDAETTALSAMDRLLLLTGRWRLEIKDPSQ